ncbi:conserved hypothetical protein [delta proteobacterium NaphS2]|nr:conserved hypothetical protein [delta proteobacterium NaphS2]
MEFCDEMMLFKKRLEISRCVDLGDVASLMKVLGVSLLEWRNLKEDMADGFDCIAWVFKNSPTTRNQWVLCRRSGALPEAFLSVEVPEHGDIVEYQIWKNGSLTPTHIGIFDESHHQVESKWGDAGHVFLHDLWAVPAEYGERVNFYRHVPPHPNRRIGNLGLIGQY